jgi:hypothetical protein
MIDRLALVTYLGLTAACGGGSLAPVMPAGGTPATSEQAEAWISQFQPGAPVLHRFRWQYRDRNEAGGGRGSARITPGDSLRLDMIGPLGAGRGAAFVIGDAEQWAEPEEEVRKVAPSFPLLWAMLGVPRAPGSFDQVRRFEGGGLVAWQFVRGADTVEMARIDGSPVRLVVDVREAGARVGRVETAFNPDGAPRTSRLDVPSAQARVQINYYETSHPASFPPDTWRPPERQP